MQSILLTLFFTVALGLTVGHLVAAADPFEEPDLEPGAKAPPFRLNDHDGNAVSLSVIGKGSWIVLAFYPKSDTPG